MSNRYIIDLIQFQAIRITVVANDETHAFELAKSGNGIGGPLGPFELDVKKIQLIDE